MVVSFNSATTEAAVNALVKRVGFSTKNKRIPQPVRQMQMQLTGLQGWDTTPATRQVSVVVDL